MTFCDDPAHLFSLEAACTLKFVKSDFLGNGTFILEFQELLLCKLVDDSSEEYVYISQDRWRGSEGGIGMVRSVGDFKRQLYKVLWCLLE